MKPAPFDYLAPTTIDQALVALAEEQRDVKILAGGQSLIPVMNLRLGRPEVLVDVCRIPELQQLTVAEDRSLRVGAAVRQAAVLADERVAATWPMLKAAISCIGHPQIRSRGTVCGSIAHADPAAELPAAAIALEATVIVRSPGNERRIAAIDFFVAPFSTALGDRELITELIFPAPAADSGWAFEESALRQGDFATAGAAVSLTRRGSLVEHCRLVLFAVAGTPVRIPGAEQAVTGQAVTNATLTALAEAVEAGLQPADDIHATGRFRAETAARLAVTAMKTAWERSHD